jgi:hypothetical protein
MYNNLFIIKMNYKQ